MGGSPAWTLHFPAPYVAILGTSISYYRNEQLKKNPKSLSISAQFKNMLTFILNSLFHSTHNNTNWCSTHQRTQSLLCPIFWKYQNASYMWDFFSSRVYYLNYTFITAMPTSSTILCTIISYKSTMGNVLVFWIPVTASPGSSVTDHTAVTRAYSPFSALQSFLLCFWNVKVSDCWLTDKNGFLTFLIFKSYLHLLQKYCQM